MNKMPDDDLPGAITAPPSVPTQTAQQSKKNAVSWLRQLMRGKVSNSNILQEALEEYIDELKETNIDEASADSQKTLITNVLKTHDLRVSDIMIPRADIVALELNASHEDLKKVFESHQFSRIPVYDASLDHVVGILHIKDLLACLLENRDCQIKDLVREVTIVPPGMTVMDLFLTLREDKKYMALVVDEHGGIDGLVTLNDVIEAVMGDIHDEFDQDERPQVIEKPDGSIIADARMEIEDFEERYGLILTEEERDDIETLGGLAFELAGHVPKKGEMLKHGSGLVLEVLDANASRVTRVRIRNIPKNNSAGEV